MIQLPAKLPTTFEDALGYPYKDNLKARWVAFYWEPCGDESVYNDGLRSGTGNPWGFLAFVRHPRVSPWLIGYDLGSSDSEPRHWLLCDLQDRDIFVGNKIEIGANLASIVSETITPIAQPAASLSMAELIVKIDSIENIIKFFKEMPPPSVQEIQNIMKREHEAIERMIDDLSGE